MSALRIQIGSYLGRLFTQVFENGVLNRNTPQTIEVVYPPSQKATGVNPWMNARWVPSVALAKEGTLRRVPPYEGCGEVPRP
jgi:hypothetical protein